MARDTITGVVESFDFGITNGSIQTDANKRFHPYVGGGGVGGPTTTIDAARKILFERLKENLSWRAREARKELTKLDNLLDMLGSDPFNMGIFKETQ